MMGEPEKPEATRIAIKFGTTTNSAKKQSRPVPSSNLGKRQRPNGLGGDSDSDSGDEQHTNGRHERITAFGDNGAEFEKRDRDKRRRADHGPLTITRQPNRDWRSEARARNRKTRPDPPRTYGSDNEKETEPADKDKPIKWGLTITRKEPEAGDGPSREEGEARTHMEGETSKDGTKSGQKPEQSGDKDSNKDNIEKDAVAALLGKTAEDRTGTRLVIDRAANETSEDDVFRRDFKDAPDESTLEDYEKMPVEEFGAALLRGMGWDGKDRGPKVKQVKRRPNQLGLGAKELKGGEDLGAWNQKKSGSGSGSGNRQRPPRLHDYRREEDKRRANREDRHRDSYKAERDRERDEERRNGHSSSRRHYNDSNSRNRYH